MTACRFTIRSSLRGKVRLTVKDEAGNIQLANEYYSASKVIQREEVKLRKKAALVMNQIVGRLAR